MVKSKMKYSESTGCFYPESVNYHNIPSDAVLVPIEDFNTAMSRPIKTKLKLSNGRVIVETESTDQLRLDKLKEDLSKIDKEVSALDSNPFTFNDHTFYPDTEFIQGMFSILPLLPSNYSERWKTAEKDSDGVNNIYVTLDKTGIQGLALAYLQFKKNNWLSGEAKKQLIKDAFLAGE